MSYLDRHWNYRSIRIIELADRKQAYLTLAAYNAENGSTWAGWLVLVFGAGMLYATVGLFYRLSNR